MPFPHIQGAFSESLVIEQSQAHAVADSLPLSQAALAEPLSVGLHAISRAGSVFGKKVLVTGCGPIGSLLIAGLRRAGAALIVAADIADLPLACAKKMGADETINLMTNPERLEPYGIDKGQFDVMFEASGSDKALRSGLAVVAPRGVIVSIGLGGDISVPLNVLVAKEIEWRPVISDIVAFDKAVDAFKLAGDKSQSMKVQIAFDPELVC